jgi:hypothetical protein
MLVPAAFVGLEKIKLGTNLLEHARGFSLLAEEAPR